MPTVQISEVDMPVESMETHSPTGERSRKSLLLEVHWVTAVLEPVTSSIHL